MQCNALTDFLVEPFSFTIIMVDPHIPWQRVGENNTELFSWHWPADDESILLIVRSVVNTTNLSIVNAAIAGLPIPSWMIRELWGCREERNGDGGPYAHDVTPSFDTNTAARLVEAAMKLSHPTHFGVVDCAQQADGTAGAQTPMCASAQCNLVTGSL